MRKNNNLIVNPEKAVLVTGGAGYIGSQVVRQLIAAEHSVIVLDDLSTGLRSRIPRDVRFIQGSIGDSALLKRLFAEQPVDTVMHLAAAISAPESISNPLKYHENNVLHTHCLLKHCLAAQIPHFIFSSSAAVYGNPSATPVDETAPTQPINPYGRSKLMAEWMIEECAQAHSLRYITLRYFNAAGADGSLGPNLDNAQHLIAQAINHACGRQAQITIYGDDYDTADGTGIRDYIHILDIADAHIKALHYLRNPQNPSLTLNCGYGQGYSVLQILKALEALLEHPLNRHYGPRRSGDPACLIADNRRICQALGWRGRHNDLTAMLRSMWLFAQRSVSR